MKAITLRMRDDRHTRSVELYIFAALLFAFNLPLLFGTFSSSFVFTPNLVSAGAWWRVLTHPFVHVSWYHLLLDGSAFLLLYHGLSERSWVRRTAYAVICAAGSLGASLLSPAMTIGGLCGLSGVAHGLMAVSALEAASLETNKRSLRYAGLISLCLVAGKSIIEAVTGQVAFAFLHFGYLGTPLTLSHAGGTLAGILAFIILRR